MKHMMMRVDAIIIARGGSKEIPKKNIMNFLGKPLLAWTIEQCLSANSVTDVWVSSDSLEILDIAKSYGVHLIERPKSISGDKSTSESAWLHAVELLREKGISTDVILAPQVTSPMREVEDIDFAIQKFKEDKLDSLFTCSMDDQFYWGKEPDGTMNSVNYNYKDRKRRQDFQQQIVENGSFYLFKPEILQTMNNRLGGKIGYFEMDYWKKFEIDSLMDVKICAALMKEFMHVKDDSA